MRPFERNLYFFFSMIIYSLQNQGVLGCTTGCTCNNRVVRCLPGLPSFPDDIGNGSIALFASGSYASQNAFEMLSQNQFLNVALKHLFVSYSQIKSIENETFVSQQNLYTLDISYNDIQEINPSTLRGLLELKSLSLSGNYGCQIFLGSFSHMTNLQELYMAKMKLRKVDKRLLEKMAKLRVLDLHGNELKHVDWTLFANLIKMTYLDISRNRISGIPNDTLSVLSRMKTVQLEWNPWRCNCAAYWLVNIPNEASDSIVCDSPPSLEYQSLINILHSSRLTCKDAIITCSSNIHSEKYGHGLNMTCDVQGDPFPDVAWVRPDGIRISYFNYDYDNYAMDDNGTITINRLGKEDAGTWKVFARNIVSQQEATIHVVVTSLPTTSTPEVTTETFTETSTFTVAVTTRTSNTNTVATTTEKIIKFRSESTSFAPHTTSGVHEVSTHSPPSSTTMTTTIYFMIAAAGGSAFLTSMICSLIYYCKRRSEETTTEEPMQEFFHSVKTPRQARRKVHSIGQLEDLENIDINFGKF